MSPHFPYKAMLLRNETELVLDNSTISSFRDCRRRALYRYVKDWATDGPEPASLTFGRGWHSALDALYKLYYTTRQETATMSKVEWNKVRASDGFLEVLIDVAYEAFLKDWTEAGYPAEPTFEDLESDPKRTPIRAKNMLIQYYLDMSTILDSWELVESEAPFIVPLDDKSTKYWYGGRMDKIIASDEGLWLVEHKTSSLYSKTAGFQSAFVDSFSPNSQIEGYMFALHWLQSQGEIKDPRPIVGVYVDAALVHKTQFYFKRIPIYYDERLVQQWHHEVTKYVAEFDKAMETNHWLRNTDSCQGKYGKCAYVDLCRMYPDHEELLNENGILAGNAPPGFVERAWTPYVEVPDAS